MVKVCAEYGLVRYGVLKKPLEVKPLQFQCSMSFTKLFLKYCHKIFVWSNVNNKKVLRRRGVSPNPHSTALHCTVLNYTVDGEC